MSIFIINNFVMYLKIVCFGPSNVIFESFGNMDQLWMLVSINCAVFIVAITMIYCILYVSFLHLYVFIMFCFSCIYSFL